MAPPRRQESCTAKARTTRGCAGRTREPTPWPWSRAPPSCQASARSVRSHRRGSLERLQSVISRVRAFSDGAQGVYRQRHVVAAPGDGPALVQLHHLRGRRGGLHGHHHRVRDRLLGVAGGAAAVAGPPVLLQEPAVRAHHGAHEPVRVVRAQQRAVAGVVRGRGAGAGHAARRARLVRGAARAAAVRHAQHVHVDAVRGPVPAHRARARLRGRAAAAARAAGRGLAAARRRGRRLRRAPRAGRRRRRRGRVLAGRRGRAARRAGGAGGAGRAAQRVLPVQHRARAVRQAARARARAGPGQARRRTARAARHVPAGAAVRAAVPAAGPPAGARRALVAPVRVRVGAAGVAAGPVRGGAVLPVQRRGAGAAPPALARAHLPAAGQLRHAHHCLVRAVGRRGSGRGQGVTGGGRRTRAPRARGGRHGGSGSGRRPRRPEAQGLPPHPLRNRRERRRCPARHQHASAVSRPPPAAAQKRTPASKSLCSANDSRVEL